MTWTFGGKRRWQYTNKKGEKCNTVLVYMKKDILGVAQSRLSDPPFCWRIERSAKLIQRKNFFSTDPFAKVTA